LPPQSKLSGAATVHKSHQINGLVPLNSDVGALPNTLQGRTSPAGGAAAVLFQRLQSQFELALLHTAFNSFFLHPAGVWVPSGRDLISLTTVLEIR